MVTSIDLLEVRIFVFELLELSYFSSDFDRVCVRLHRLIRFCISDLLDFYVAVPLNPLTLSKICSRKETF